MSDVPTLKKYESAQEAAFGLSQSSYSGTVESAQSSLEPSARIEKYTTAQEAAMGLSHSTYTGTVEAAN